MQPVWLCKGYLHKWAKESITVEQKTKFIIIGTAAILVISLLVNLQTSATKKRIRRERDDLREENVSLSKKIEEGREYVQTLQDKLNALEADLERISKEKEEIQRQYDVLAKEKDEFMAKINAGEIKIVEVGEETPSPTREAGPVISDTYWAGILKTKTDLQLQLENIHKELKTLQINNEELKNERSILESELKDLAKEKQDLEQRLSYQHKVLDNITAERILETNTKRQLQERLNSLKNENIILKRQVKILNQHKVSLERKLARAQEDKSTLERRFNEMTLLLEDRLSQIGDIRQRLDTIRSDRQPEIPRTPPKKESIELPPIVVHPQIERMPALQERFIESVSWGEILAVNKENNFVIINLGEDSGIKVGDTFKVYRQAKPIATIEAIQVRRSIAACDIKTETSPIQVGDTIR